MSIMDVTCRVLHQSGLVNKYRQTDRQTNIGRAAELFALSWECLCCFTRRPSAVERLPAPACWARPRIFSKFQTMPLIWFAAWPVNSKSRRNYLSLLLRPWARQLYRMQSSSKCVTVEFVVVKHTCNTLSREHKHSNTDFFPNRLCTNKNLMLITQETLCSQP
jgi:hypothetical protein